MKPKKSENKKAQFFIASAIIIVVTTTLIFHYVERLEKVQSVDVEVKNIKVLYDNIVKGYQDIAEDVLAEVSANSSLDAETYFLNNLTQYTQEMDTFASENGMMFDADVNIIKASSTIMNASVNITLYTDNAVYKKNFYAVAGINITVYNRSGWVIIGGFGSGAFTRSCCTFRFFVQMEYNTPEPGLTNASFNETYIGIAGGVIERASNCTFRPLDPGIGLYEGICSRSNQTGDPTKNETWQCHSVVNQYARTHSGIRYNDTCISQPPNYYRCPFICNAQTSGSNQCEFPLSSCTT